MYFLNVLVLNVLKCTLYVIDLIILYNQNNIINKLEIVEASASAIFVKKGGRHICCTIH